MYIQWVTTHVYSIFIRLAIVAPPPNLRNSTKIRQRPIAGQGHPSVTDLGVNRAHVRLPISH